VAIKKGREIIGEKQLMDSRADCLENCRRLPVVQIGIFLQCVRAQHFHPSAFKLLHSQHLVHNPMKINLELVVLPVESTESFLGLPKDMPLAPPMIGPQQNIRNCYLHGSALIYGKPRHIKLILGNPHVHQGLQS
jgi:hypothetical protein